MFFTVEGQTLYLNNWKYNSAKVLNSLEDIIIKAGPPKEILTNGRAGI